METNTDILDQLSKIQSPTPPPKKPSFFGGKPKDNGYQAVEVGNADGVNLTAASLQALLSDRCSDSDRDLAFRTLAKACGKDLVCTIRSYLQNIGSVGGLTLVALLIVRSTIYSGKLGAQSYLAVTPGLCLFTGTVLMVVGTVYRRRSDIQPILATSASAIFFAIFFSSLY